jgi:DNA-binding NtrC family response regulator
MLKAAIIDGNTIARKLLTTVLTSSGYTVVGKNAPNSAGIASTITLQPQILFIDIGTADEEGMAKLDTLRNELPNTVILMVSGSIDSTTVLNAVQHGVHGFIVKPFNAVTVLKSIQNACSNMAKLQQKAAASATA